MECLDRRCTSEMKNEIPGVSDTLQFCHCWFVSRELGLGIIARTMPSQCQADSCAEPQYWTCLAKMCSSCPAAD